MKQKQTQNFPRLIVNSLNGKTESLLKFIKRQRESGDRKKSEPKKKVHNFIEMCRQY